MCVRVRVSFTVLDCLNSSRAPRKEDPVGAWSHSITTLSGLTWACQSTPCQCWPLWERQPMPSAMLLDPLSSTAGEAQRCASKLRELLMLTERKSMEWSFAKIGMVSWKDGVKLNVYFHKYWSLGNENARLEIWWFLWCLLFYLIAELDFNLLTVRGR
jgi:hypothetical protein